MKFAVLYLVSLVLSVTSYAQAPPKLFTKIGADQSGVVFTNVVTESDSLHVMKYEYMYNGHGVGIGDFDNDGLPDIFISGNAVPSKLFLNKGNFRFEDITNKAGVAGDGRWATGVSIADINGDGLDDIYVCYSGNYSKPEELRNRLYINQGLTEGVPVFKELAADYGLDAPGTQSTQALFFDYDLDGDLDMFLLNHSNHTYNPFLNTRKIRSTPDMRFGNRLFRNDSNGSQFIFTDVTIEAGIVNNALNFGLSVNASDVNGDGWPDIYTTSDYTEKDCLYINNGNGTFSESIEASMAHMSKYSMGADIADFNNDGRVDILTLDMLPADNYRQKLLKGPDEYDQYHMLADSGYYHQQMRNMLQLNQGLDHRGMVRFSDIGQLAGVSNTDWSWAGLMADFDNDGWKDIFITNGYLRDFTNLDFLRYTVSDAQLEEAKKGNFNFKTFDLVKKMPSNKLGSYAFRNNRNLTFTNMSAEWGINDLSVSNGAAYADFDGDGDLDLIVCRNNDPVALYRNERRQQTPGHFIKIRLEGRKANRRGFGAKIHLYAGSNYQLQEQYPVRGYQSSVTTDIHFGMGELQQADSIIIEWPGGEISKSISVAVDSLYLFRQADAIRPTKKDNPKNQHLVFDSITNFTGLDFRHSENEFVDFKDEPLLPYQLSRMGPAIAAADVNGDGLDDLFVGGAIEQSSVLYLQTKEGNFVKGSSQPWLAEAAHEDVNALFFDADGDGDMDLYVVSGGNEYGQESPEFADRLYLNDGKGNFIRSGGLPLMTTSKQAVAAGDFDGDGDLDLFIGGKSEPGSFPIPSRSYLLRNDSKDGKILFTDVTADLAPQLLAPGIINDAAWTDIDNDGYPELMLAGEWMPLRLFRNQKGRLNDISMSAGLGSSAGLWSKIKAKDLNGDGKVDFIIGNAGNNNQFRASVAQPMELFAGDFDDNGRLDALICYYIDGKTYPMASRDELLDQMPGLKKKFVFYRDYAKADMNAVVSKTQLSKAKRYVVEELNSVVLLNKGNFVFELMPLPAEAQFSRVGGIEVDDFTGDGRNDILLTGNFHSYRVQLGRADASMGLLLQYETDQGFKPWSAERSGLFASGDVRGMVQLRTAKGKMLVIARNDDKLQVYTIK